jgi:putative glutamine amidotransferase
MTIPLIGITAGNDPKVPEHYILRWDYVHGITAAGGLPVILAPLKEGDQTFVLDRLDGVILTGGPDINPELYGAAPDALTFTCTPERDQFELSLAKEAFSRDMPILGICRGMQMMNLALGGDLIQDIRQETGSTIAHNDPKRPRNVLAHEVNIELDSMLYKIIGQSQIAVNSFHHQAVGKQGQRTKITARSTDNVVEGIEILGLQFALGIQWHPESLWEQSPQFFALFDAIVQKAKYAAYLRNNAL